MNLASYGLIYVGTPYSRYPGGPDEAFEDAGELMGRLICELGLENIFSPITHTHPIATYGELDALACDFWLRFDLPIMKKSDAMIVAMMAGWGESRGIKYEIDHFIKAGKPIFYLDPVTLDIGPRP